MTNQKMTRNGLLAVLVLSAGIIWAMDPMDGDNSDVRLSNRDMSQVTGTCGCSTEEDCGYDCSGNGLTCSGCSGPCGFAATAGTQPTCCDTSGTGTCNDTGYVTCKTIIHCKTHNYDDKECTNGACSGPSEETCALCSNGGSYPVRRLNQVCNSS